MPDEHAVLIERDGRCTLRLERRLAHDPRRVWRALTEHDRLAAWHPSPFRIAGELVEFSPSPGIPEIEPGRVLACEEPRLLAYTWAGDELRFTLEERDGGCLLTLEHTFADRLKAARDGAGWHLCLRALAGALDGEREARPDEHRVPEGWDELNADYQQRFGISPEQATPVPPR
jgi:uncharacterized protein YndB with AHSA1/START domain